MHPLRPTIRMPQSISGKRISKINSGDRATPLPKVNSTSESTRSSITGVRTPDVELLQSCITEIHALVRA